MRRCQGGGSGRSVSNGVRSPPPRMIWTSRGPAISSLPNITGSSPSSWVRWCEPGSCCHEFHRLWSEAPGVGWAETDAASSGYVHSSIVWAHRPL